MFVFGRAHSEGTTRRIFDLRVHPGKGGDHIDAPRVSRSTEGIAAVQTLYHWNRLCGGGQLEHNSGPLSGKMGSSAPFGL